MSSVISMEISKFKDLSIPLFKKWEEYSYDNCEKKSEINCLITKKKLITRFTSTVNEMFMDSLLYFKNLDIILFPNISKLELYSIYSNNLKKYITPYGIRELSLTHKQFQGLTYQIFYDSKLKFKSVNDIDNKIKEFIGKQRLFPRYKISLIIFKQNKKLKKKLEDIGLSYFKPSNILEKSVLSTILLNNKSLEFLNKFNINSFISRFKESKRYFLKYRKFLYENIESSDHHKFMIFSSTCLYLLGLRKMNDLDLYVSDLTRNVNTEELKEKILSKVTDEEYNFMDFSVENTKYWKKYWKIWLPEWARLCGTHSFNNILVDSNYHFYWLGVKVISPEVDIQRRIHRNRPRAYGDLIVLKRENLYKFDLPTPTFLKNEFKLVSELKMDELINYLDNGWEYRDNKRIEIYKETEIDRTRFISTVVWWLKKMYKFEVTANDVRDILRIKSNIKPDNPFVEKHIEFKKKMYKIKKMINC